MKRHLRITGLLAGLLVSTTHAAKYNWVGGNGEDLAWGTPSHWSNNIVPTPADTALFLSGADLSILVPSGTSLTTVETQGNTNVTFKLSAPVAPGTTSLTLSTFLDVGSAKPTGINTPSIVTVTGSEGVFETRAIRVGIAQNLHGNQLVFTDGVTVTSSFTNSSSAIGRYGFDNLLKAEKGANVTIDNLSIGSDAGIANNRLVVTGENTLVTIGGTGTQRGLRVGHGPAGTTYTSYADAMQNNYVHVSDGGKLAVTGVNGNGSGISILVGAQTKAHDNYILVEGANSTFELGKGTSSGSTALQIGEATRLNYGGNYVEIRDGGRLISSADHLGTITIHGHDASEPQTQASNRLTVGDDGTVDVNGAINVTGGLLQLSSKGSLTAATVTVSAGGRFEAAGEEFRTTGAGATTIQNLGTLAVEGESLSLQSLVKLENGATLELHLLDDQTIAGLDFLSGGKLTIGSTSKLHLVADNTSSLQLGATWQLFSGDTLNNIIGTFNLSLADLPTLDAGLLWDFSAFDQDGGWTLAVIPEPHSVAFLSIGAALLARQLFRRKHQPFNS